MSYYLDVPLTGDMTPFEDAKDAIEAYNTCDLECQLSNEDGEIIAEKMFTDDGENVILESMTQWDEVGHEYEEVEA